MYIWLHIWSFYCIYIYTYTHKANNHPLDFNSVEYELQAGRSDLAILEISEPGKRVNHACQVSQMQAQSSMETAVKLMNQVVLDKKGYRTKQVDLINVEFQFLYQVAS